MAKKEKEAEESAEQKETRESALRKAYSAATNDLREKFRKEFNEFYGKRAKDLGYEWQPKPTPEERAADEVERLFEEFPSLRERFAGPEEDEPEASDL